MAAGHERIGAAIGLVALGIVGYLNHDALRVRASRLSPVSQLPSPEVARALASGYLQLAADYYWLEAIQYYGNPTNEGEEYRSLGVYLGLVTDLDPRFCYAYVFGGSAMPYHRLDERWSNTQATIDLLEKGESPCRDDWRVPFLLGYSLFTFTDRYAEAASFVSRSADLPRAPHYLASLAARLYGQGGELQNARALAEARLQIETDSFAIGELKTRIAQLELEIRLRRLQAAARQYRGAVRMPLRDLRDLVRAGLISEVPVDPFGGEFFVNGVGDVASRHEDRLLRLQVHPGGHLREEVVN